VSTIALPAAPLRRDAKLIGLVGLVHGLSHFCQLLLAPLFPWLRDAFGVGYGQLGLLMTAFFVTSCAVQTASGFLVDRHGPRPVLLGGLALLAAAALGLAASTSFAMLMACSVVAGMGNGVFHPVDYTLLNRKVAPQRLGHAYSVHGITGSLGWALAPALLVPLTMVAGWRAALLVAAGVVLVVLGLVWWQREAFSLAGEKRPAAGSAEATATVARNAVSRSRPQVRLAQSRGASDFLRLPAVWKCFGFFFLYAGALSVVQTFAVPSAAQLHGVSSHWAALCLTIYMLCAAAGMVAGGFLVQHKSHCETVIAVSLGVATLVALTLGFGTVPGLAVPWLFGLLGLATGVSGPSRDLLVKQATPLQASGRVYGVVYGGLDIGQAVVPLVVGVLMDQGSVRGVWMVLAMLQLMLIVSAFQVRRVQGGPVAQRPPQLR
jgi:FSR family fosmidomycin resistance protein-like MFS transporter